MEIVRGVTVRLARLLLKAVALFLDDVTVALAGLLLWGAFRSEFWQGFVSYGPDLAKAAVMILFLAVICIPSALGAKAWGLADRLPTGWNHSQQHAHARG